MRRFRFLIAPTLIVAFLCIMSSTGMALEPIHKDPALYGHLDQQWTGLEYMCGPTAAVNSFVYLQKRYPGIYGEALVGDPSVDGNLIDTARYLSLGQYMNTTEEEQGTRADRFIYGKWKYIEDRPGLRGKTKYAAELSGTWGAPPRPEGEDPPMPPKPSEVRDGTDPTWDFIYSELKACEDVEILIDWGSGGHFVTLTGCKWTDENEDNIIQKSEAVIWFIDPDGGDENWSLIWNNTNNINSLLKIEYLAHSNASITMAVSESPRIPEPSTVIMMAASVAGLAGVVLRKMRKV